MKNILWCQISDVMIKRLLLLLIIFASSFSVKAQGLPTLKVTTITANGVANFPDTIYQGVQYNFSITVANLDSTPFVNNGTPFSILMQKVDTGGFLPFAIYITNLQFTIAAFDSMVFFATDSFSPPQLKLGNNVVVVWPSVTSSIINYIDDTISTYLVGTSGIPEIEKSDLLFYPNPFIDFLNIRNTFDYTGQVFIYDGTGRVVYNSGRKETYNLSFLKSGMYLIEVRKNNIAVARRKMMKY